MLFPIFLLWTLLCPQDTSPTLPETLEFLTAKLPELATYTGKSNGDSVSERITAVRSNACNFEIETFRERGKTAIIRDETLITLNLAHLQPAIVRVTEVGEPPWVVLTLDTRDHQKTIRIRSVNRMPYLGPQRSDRTDERATFLFDKKENAERIAKAITHAAKLCSERKEPF